MAKLPQNVSMILLLDPDCPSAIDGKTRSQAWIVALFQILYLLAHLVDQ